MSGKRCKVFPIQKAPVGSTWELCVRDVRACIVVILGERSSTSGNYPCVVLFSNAWWSSKPGTYINAAVTTAHGWRRVT